LDVLCVRFDDDDDEERREERRRGFLPACVVMEKYDEDFF
jgi:hypothetical protein